LLLGDEKEGIAPELFGQVDFTVEISQLGKTRSLNVHVSAALCIHQFATQWLVKKGKNYPES
jgi:tRNA G18 (ribose-2'-O)-methylase SpoU